MPNILDIFADISITIMIPDQVYRSRKILLPSWYLHELQKQMCIVPIKFKHVPSTHNFA